MKRQNAPAFICYTKVFLEILFYVNLPNVPEYFHCFRLSIRTPRLSVYFSIEYSTYEIINGYVKSIIAPVESVSGVIH